MSLSSIKYVCTLLDSYISSVCLNTFEVCMRKYFCRYHCCVALVFNTGCLFLFQPCLGVVRSCWLFADSQLSPRYPSPKRKPCLPNTTVSNKYYNFIRSSVSCIPLKQQNLFMRVPLTPFPKAHVSIAGNVWYVDFFIYRVILIELLRGGRVLYCC